MLELLQPVIDLIVHNLEAVAASGQFFLMGKGGGGGSSGGNTSTNTTTVNVPAKTVQETQLDEINLRTAQRQEVMNLMMMSEQNPQGALEYLGRPTADTFYNNDTFKSAGFQQTLRDALKSPEGFATPALRTAFEGALGPPTTYTSLARFDTPDFRTALQGALDGTLGTSGTSGTPGTGGFETQAFRDALNKVIDVASPFSGLDDFNTPAFKQQLQDSIDTQAQEKTLTDKVNKQLLARITGEAFLSPEEEVQLDKLYAGAQKQGEEDLTTYGDQIAAQRGMRKSDSPIGNELVRERGRLALGLESAKAGTKIELSQGAKNFEESVRQFQEGLRNQGFQNRLGLASAAPLSFGLSQALASQRFQGISQSSTTTGSQGTQRNASFGNIAGGIGGLLYGLSSAKSSGLF